MDDSAVSAISNPSYQDYRAEANLHLQKRTECLQKAAVARRKGMGDVSTYYTRLVCHHYSFSSSLLASDIPAFCLNNSSFLVHNCLMLLRLGLTSPL
mgnify:FL=1